MCRYENTTSPGAGICIIYACVTLPIYFLILYKIDLARYYHVKASGPIAKDTPPEDEDIDVRAERERVLSGAADNESLRAVNLRKTFKIPKKKGKKQPPKVAVGGVTFSTDAGCFALLGPNGAGKSTTIGMLSGELRPSGGDGYVCGYSIKTQLMEIFNLCGMCPQFGGLFPELVTLEQHLVLFARLKGMPEKDIPTHVDRVITNFGLEDHRKKDVKKLSGGTRRKLIAAIALESQPRVCFLDEPTTGVDVGTRQFLWDRIRARGARGCTILLTTHNMEEADALAMRIGIMVNGRLEVLGTPQQLKSRHGGGYHIEVKGPANTADGVEALIKQYFPTANKTDGHGGYLTFEALPEAGASSSFFPLGAVFDALEKARSTLGIESYTLSQTTLEQVFLNIAARQVEDGEKMEIF